MTSLVHPRGSLRRYSSASHSHPRRPCGGGLGGRITAWDAMGYHGITWASINRLGASAPRLKRNLYGPLMGCPLKEWLRGNSPRTRRETAPPAARASHEINPWLTAGPLSRAYEVPNTGNAWLRSRVVPRPRKASFSLMEQTRLEATRCSEHS